MTTPDKQYQVVDTISGKTYMSFEDATDTKAMNRARGIFLSKPGRNLELRRHVAAATWKVLGALYPIKRKGRS